MEFRNSDLESDGIDKVRYIRFFDENLNHLTTNMPIDPSDPSPRKPGVGGLQNFVSVNSPYSDKTRSSREAIKVELDGKLRFDDPSVFKRLGIDRLSANFVDAYVASFQQDASAQVAKTN